MTPTPDTDRRYLVWSNERGGFWRKGRHGYTQLAASAGRFTRTEAAAIVADGNLAQPPDEAPNEVLLCAPDGNPHTAADSPALMAAAGRTIEESLGVPPARISWEDVLGRLMNADPAERVDALHALGQLSALSAVRLANKEAHG
jgi:hypothetical protein